MMEGLGGGWEDPTTTTWVRVRHNNIGHPSGSDLLVVSLVWYLKKWYGMCHR